MSLTAQDQSDLAGLVSELGSPESDARAQHLMQNNPEAAEFYRQITSVRRALETEETDTPPLTAQETDEVAAAILVRSRRRRSRPSFLLRHPWRLATAAAVVMAAVLSWYAFRGSTRTFVATGISYPVRASLNVSGLAMAERVELEAGQLLETKDHIAVLELTNGSRVVVLQRASLIIQGTGKDIELQKGTLFLEVADSLHVQLGDLAVQLDGPAHKIVVEMSTSRRMCKVYAGNATVSRHGRVTELSVGQVAHWDQTTDDAQIGTGRTDLPPWVIRAFDAAKRADVQ